MDYSLERAWWSVLLGGLAAIAFGILVLVWPGLTLATLIMLFGIFSIAYGVIYATAALAGVVSGRWSGLLVGLAGIAAGVLTLVWPGLAALTMLYIVAVWAIVAGVFEIGTAFEAALDGLTRTWLALLGLVSIGFGILFFVRPLTGALSLATTIGIFGLALGAMRVGHSIALLMHGRRVAKERLSQRPTSAEQEPPMRRAA